MKSLKIFRSLNFNVNLENNENFKYSFVAFLDKTLYVSFINILFLVSVNFVENIEISHFSLSILIINNLRPAFDSISSLLPPIISKNISEKRNNFLILSRTLEINSLVISTIIIFSLALVKNESIYLFINNEYESGVFKIIFLSILASTFRSLYYPSYLEKLYGGQERRLLIFTTINQTALLISYLFVQGTYLNNFVLIFIIYELLNFIYFTKNKNYTFFDYVKNLKLSYYSSIILSSLYIFDIYYLEIHLVLLFILFTEIILFLKRFFQDKSWF